MPGIDDWPWIISVDDHVLEPPHVWQARVPAKHRERAPQLVVSDAGEWWHYEDKRIATTGLSAAAGKKKGDWSPSPVTYADMRPGCYDSVARLADMNEDHVLASLCFPSLPRFAGQLFSESTDFELGLACIHAYNDWMLDEWSGSAPGRYVPLIIIPFWDTSLAVREIERCAAKGAKAIAFSENPSALGWPSIHDAGKYWDPVFDVANETGMPLCMHIGSSSRLPETSPDAPLLVTAIWGAAANSAGAMVDWLLSGHLLERPNLKLCLSEGMIGWMPYFVERAGIVWEKQRDWARQGKFSQDALLRPTPGGGEDVAEHEGMRRLWDMGENFSFQQLFRDHVFGCFIEDTVGVALLDIIGVDNVMLETDYPHSDSAWPNSLRLAQKQLAGRSDEDVYKIMQGNAWRVFDFVPAEAPR